MFRIAPLCSSAQDLLEKLARGPAQMCIPDLLASEQTTINGLPNSLSDEVAFDRTSLDQVKDRSERARELKALGRLHITLWQVGIMQYEDTWNIAVASEVGRDRHVQLRRVHIRQIVKAERCLVTVDTLHFFIPVPGPERPKHEIGPISRRKERKPVNAAVLSNPVPDLHVVRVCVFCESCSFGLLRGEKALLLLCNLEEPPRCFPV